MTVLTADQQVRAKDTGVQQAYPVADNVRLYKGQLLNLTGGFARLSVSGDATPIIGVAFEQVDNTLVGHAAGLKKIRVETGRRHLLTGSGFTQASLGVLATVVDGNTVGTAGTSNVGLIVEFVSATQVWVFVPVMGHVA